MPEGVSFELISEEVSVLLRIVKAVDMTRGAKDVPGNTVNGYDDKSL